MTTLPPGDSFPDAELADHTGTTHRLSGFTHPTALDERLGFDDGYPLIVVFYRGFFCPRDQQQMRWLVEFQSELNVNFCQLVTISVQPPLVQAAFRAGLGANWPFLADVEGQLIRELDILDETEGEYADTAQPYTFVLQPDLRVHTVYDGWSFVGRPTLEELRQDLRDIMSGLSHYSYDAWNTSEVRRVRIPQSEWRYGVPSLGSNGLRVAEGTVQEFNLRTGNGTISFEGRGAIFFNFTAIPGEGYRTIKPGTRVRFEVVETRYGLTARNIQPIADK